VQGDDDLKTTLEHRTHHVFRVVHVSHKVRAKQPPSQQDRRSETIDLTLKSANQDDHQVVPIKEEVMTDSPPPEQANQSEVVDLTFEDIEQDEPSVKEVVNDSFDIMTRHPAESVNQFLERMPVSDPRCAQQGPWLWIHSLNQTPHKEASVQEFIQGGAQLLRAYNEHRDEIERQCRGKHKGAVTRKLKPYREQLKPDVLNLATATSTTCGKWMLFPGANDVSQDWHLIAHATADGKLGQTSKVATWDPSKSHVLICIYTPDFNDVAQIKRVLQCLLGLGLKSLANKTIYYKCDAYTYLGIESENPFKLKASLYSSKEILDSAAVQVPATSSATRQLHEHQHWDF
jgi:hypothetical protein